MITKNRINNLLIALVLSILLSSCATTYSTNGYDYPILDIQNAVVENLPQGLGATNSNRRVFYSKKFLVSQDKKGNIPLIMRIIILGDRRPYALEVETRQVSITSMDIEVAFDDGSGFRGQLSLAKRVVTRIQDELAQRRKNKNIFDDFKPF